MIFSIYYILNRSLTHGMNSARNRQSLGKLVRNLQFLSKLNTFEHPNIEAGYPRYLLTKKDEGLNFKIQRHYAKGKDRKKEKGKAKVVINELQIAQVLNVDSVKTQMEHSIEQLKEDFVKHLSLRSASGSIESLVVTVDGEDHTLQELAQISRKNPKTVVIDLAIFPQAIPEVLKSIENSALNLNPQQDGTTLYVPIPKVTKEHRENLSKNAKQSFIKCKDNIRGVQNKFAKSLKKKDGVSEDLVRNIEQQLKALADKYIEEAEQILGSKQKELLGESA